jgi:hypothetical protein
VNAARIFRALIVMRGTWILIAWLFGWEASGRPLEFTLTHPYTALIADDIIVALGLGILLGMWFFQPWARSIFGIFVIGSLLANPFRMPQQPPSVPSHIVAPLGIFMWLSTLALAAMLFLPSLRSCFRANDA